jgi:hypothetical protein
MLEFLQSSLVDPGCPQTQWLRAVLTTAGFQINEGGSSGSWVA